MGMDVRIGPWVEDHDLSMYHRVPLIMHAEAPAAEGSWMQPHINSFGAHITGWNGFFTRHPEMKTLASVDEHDDWARGAHELKKADLVIVELELAKLRTKWPKLVPSFRDECIQARDLALLEWFTWWIEFSIREFGEDMAALEVTW